MADEERPFVITVRNPWTLWILPVIAALYFLAIILLNILDYRIKDVSYDMLVMAGVGLFILVAVIELPFLMRRRRKRVRAAAPMAAGPSSAEPLGDWDDELLTTTEMQQGLSVVEYSAPAKSRNANSVYTKTYVPVSTTYVMRVETLVADPTDV